MQPQPFIPQPPVYLGQFVARLVATPPPPPAPAPMVLVPLVPVSTAPAPMVVRYDFSGLGKLANEAGFVREMQQLFIDRVPGQLAQLAADIEHEDWLTITHWAHSLRATFSNLRIEPGTALLKELEIIAYQHRDKLELLAILKVVTSAADAVVSIFRQELRHGP